MPRPRVLVLSTGSELTEPGQPLAAGGDLRGITQRLDYLRDRSLRGLDSCMQSIRREIDARWDRGRS